jgi:signal transduction histidine kinase
LARVDRGNMPLKVAPTDVGGLVRDTVAKFQTTAHHQGVELRLDTEEDIWAELDTMRIEQAVRNVLANALAHTPRDGRIEVSVRHDGPATLVLTVADSGPGFPDDFVARAFDPFTRADAGRSRRDGGAGLGLAIVKGIVEAHGGSVAAANKPLGGAVVTLRVAKRIGT